MQEARRERGRERNGKKRATARAENRIIRRVKAVATAALFEEEEEIEE